jgi:hypothetical protein
MEVKIHYRVRKKNLLSPILKIYADFGVLAAEKIVAAVCWITTLFSLPSGYVI